MAIQSRSRAPRTAGGDKIKSHVHTTQPPNSASRVTHTHSNIKPHQYDDEDAPPAKRRKLSIRQKQTTLDNFASFTHNATRPPTKVSVAQPHGQLVETLNGVQRVLDADEDDLSPAPSGTVTPKKVGRVPQPASITVKREEKSKQEEKRTLRSQDEGLPKLKSELAIYFTNYEDVIFDAPKEEDFITVDSGIYITDDTPTNSPSRSNKSASKASPSQTKSKSAVNGTPTPHRTSSNQFNGSPSLNFDLIARGLTDDPEDPLTDEHFLKSHRRAERKEKQLRNIEKERAMHEKVQLERILDGLQGHDWLKVLGITGITDGEAKKYEVKRDYFIAEVNALVDKFKEWKEQERRQKLKQEVVITVKESADSEAVDESEEGSVGPPSSDLNASAARQLQQETVSALKNSTNASKQQHLSKGKDPALKPLPPPPEPEVPITSFYSKQHLRDAALGKARHGRNVYAFGQPVPELGEQDFELPDGFATEDAIRANAREKRRRKRESVANT